MKKPAVFRKLSVWAVSLIWGIVLPAWGSMGPAAEEDERAFLGVVVQFIEHAQKKSLGITHGVRVVEVEKESAAEKAGIRKDDVILSIDNQDVLSPRDLIEQIRKHKPGDKVWLMLYREEGKEKKLQVQLGERETSGPQPPQTRFGRGGAMRLEPRPWLGVRLHGMDDDLAAYFSVKAEQGVLVLDVDEDGPAAKGGIRPGDVILQLDQERVKEPQDVYRILSQLKCGQEVSALIRHKGKDKSVNITIGKREWEGNAHFRWFRNGDGEGGFFPMLRELRDLRLQFPPHGGERMERDFIRRLPRDRTRIRIEKKTAASI